MSDSLTRFFYNLVPGALFILALGFLKILDLNYFQDLPVDIYSWQIQALLIILLGLFWGFVFQGLTKLIREHLCLNEKVWQEIKKNNEKAFQEALTYLPKVFRESNVRDIDNVRDIESAMYYMHNYLLAKGFDRQATFFADRAAFWLNIFCGSVLIALIVLIKGYDCEFFFASLVAATFSFWLGNNYLKRIYDVVIKTFLIVNHIKRNK